MNKVILLEISDNRKRAILGQMTLAELHDAQRHFQQQLRHALRFEQPESVTYVLNLIDALSYELERRAWDGDDAA